VRLLVRASPSGSSSTFSLQPVMELEALGMDLAEDDVLHNLVTRESQHMRGVTPWRGCKEKDPLLLQTLIESTTLAGDIVLDCTAATGTLALPNSFIPGLASLILKTKFPFRRVQGLPFTHAEGPDVISLLWRRMQQFLKTSFSPS
jgi:hypothetical protein